MACSFRHPVSTEAYRRGFAPGVREDYELQNGDLPNVEFPVVFLDNDFREPDLDRYLERFHELDPSIAVLGDAYSRDEAEELDEVARELLEDDSYKEIVVVPKCSEAFSTLSESVTLGYPNGYSDLEPGDYSRVSDWRGRRVHILGGASDTQYEVVQELTQPNLRDDAPADIAGVDWNGFSKIAYLGEYWSRDGWQEADHLSIRETVQKSLDEIKRFWQDKGVWPETEPVELYGEPVEKPDELIWMDRGGDPISTQEELEEAYVGEYEERGKVAFRSEVEKKFTEYREGWRLV